ncbi:MAG: hypothetical protein KF703_15875, partial [Actinobacteria bacterium]|nr:hypothetical protein [Actinomycetota bacterium]
VVMRNSKASLRRRPAGVVTRLTWDAWPHDWKPSAAFSLGGHAIEIVPTDRSQVVAADDAIRRWRSNA